MVAFIGPVKNNDIAIVAEQLGRAPRGFRRVVSRCESGHPQVIENSPFTEDGKPFPTLYWLTCPHKVKAVSQLEDEGWAETLQEKLLQDDELLVRYNIAQENYKQLRRLRAQGLDHPVFETGIGGVKDINAVKCLHAHYAHYLATGKNPVGEMVDRKISGLKCKEFCN